jgi:putative ABC transport system permease protein
MLIAHRNLLKDKTRLGLSVGGVALSVMLIMLLNGFLAGMNRQITSYLDNSPGSIIVAQSGVSNLLGATSILPPGITNEVDKMEGVSKVVPLLSQFVILELHGKKQPAYMIGYLPEIGGGPWAMVEGRSPQVENEVVFDSVLAQRHNIGLGDSLEVMGQDFIIVGLSGGTTSWMTSFFFMQKQAVENLLRIPHSTSFLLITPSNDIPGESVRQRLSNLEGIDAYSKVTMAENDLNLFAKVFSAPLRLMVAIAFLVGTLIVGLVIYTATVERQREYGVLKAIGARSKVLYMVVITQAITATTAGAIVGLLVVNLVSWIIMSIRPQFLIVHEPQNIVWALAAGMGMAFVGALLPARIMAGLAPAEVFRK